MINCSENLKFFRESAGLSQPELAKKIGISQANISRWERGAVLPNIEFCIKLANFYGITIDELLGINDECAGYVYAPVFSPTGEYLSADEYELLSKFRRLSPNLKELTLDTVRNFSDKQSESEKAKNKK